MLTEYISITLSKYFIAFICFILVRIFIFILRLRHKKPLPFKRENKIKTFIIIGSGGHTMEMLSLVRKLGPNYSPRIYVLASTDRLSEAKVHELEAERSKRIKAVGKEVPQDYLVEPIMRAREVGQSLATSIVTSLAALLHSLVLGIRYRPDLVLTNGPGTCIPVCFSAILLHILGVKRAAVVYVESICRVSSLSLSGRLLYPVADHFVVQWPQLKARCPKAKLMQNIV